MAASLLLAHYRNFIGLSSNNFITLLAFSWKNTNNTEKGSRLDTKHAECFEEGPCASS